MGVRGAARFRARTSGRLEPTRTDAGQSANSAAERSKLLVKLEPRTCNSTSFSRIKPIFLQTQPKLSMLQLFHRLALASESHSRRQDIRLRPRGQRSRYSAEKPRNELPPFHQPPLCDRVSSLAKLELQTSS